MIIRVNRELCIGCCECHEFLRQIAADMPDIAFGTGVDIDDNWAEMFDAQIQRAYECCPTGALFVEG